MNIIIPGPPISKMRPKIVRRGDISIGFDPQSKVKDDVSLIMKSQCPEILNLESYSLDMKFFIQIPKSTSKKKRELLITSGCTKKPDLDNYVKFYLDAGNGIIWSDDSKIVYIECQKSYSDNPRTEIYVR